jgi:hypothetical protein
VTAPENSESAGGAAAPVLDPGSFRDWDSRVFYENGRVLRALSEDGLRDWLALSESTLFAEAVNEGKLVRTEQVDGAAVPAGLEAAAVLEHDRIPFVSYPYEWPFSMLKDAALLQLDLLERALAEDLVLKDSTPYNVQWRGAKPVFIDVGSFERLGPGEPWAGYRQFCMLFLYPLLLQAYKGIAFQPWLRGRLAGIPPAEARAVMSFRDLFRRGVPTHVALHARLERKNQETARDVKQELRKAGFKKEYILANVRGCAKLVRRLEWKPGRTEWNQYGATTSYTDADAVRKEAFVREVVHSRSWDLAWDVEDRGRELPLRGGHRRRRRRGGRPVPLAARRRRHLDTSARRRRHRPVTRARLGRRRAPATRGERQARPRALSRGRPPRRHLGERARVGIPVLAPRARLRARDRVPDAR